MTLDPTAAREPRGAEERDATTRDALGRDDGNAVESLDELAVDIWASDAELDAFLGHVRGSRRSDVA